MDYDPNTKKLKLLKFGIDKTLAIFEELLSIGSNIVEVFKKTDQDKNEILSAISEKNVATPEDIQSVKNDTVESINGIREELKKKLEEELLYEVDEDKIVSSVLSKVQIPTPENGKDYVLTEEDKLQIASSIEVPVVEKIIEKTEVIKEQPVVTEIVKKEIVEVAKHLTPQEIADRLNSLPKTLDWSVLKNIPYDVTHGSGGKRTIHRGGMDRFTALLDTPKSYSSQALKAVRVKSDESGLEFYTPSTSSGTVTSVSVVTANGISGSVANATTTPAITLDISGLDATKIANGSVSNTEFQYLDGVTSAIQTQLNGKVPTSRTLTINGTAYDLSADRSWTISGISGLTATRIPYADSSTTLADDSNHVWDNTNKRVGVQVSSPQASIHSDAVVGETISPPSSITITSSLDTTIDRVTSYSVSQIDAPTAPSIPTVAFTYIDMPTDNTWYATQNTGGTGFVAYGQTINYSIYGARYVDGQTVKNPTAFTSITFTDTINDGATQFSMDIGNWTTPNGYVDTFIISRYDSYTGTTQWIDVGNVTTYSDSGFTGSNTTVDSSYSSSGATWNASVAQYKTLNGSQFRSDYIGGNNTDANISNAYLIINVSSWGTLSNDGFYVGHHNSNYFDIGSSTSYNDYGQSGTGDISSFTANAFLHFNTSLTPASSLVADPINYGGGSFIADNSTWSIEVWDYKTHPSTGEKYYVASPVTVSYGTDDNSSNSMYFSGSLTAGDGSGAVVKLLQNGSVVSASDISAGTTWSISSPSSDISTSLNITTYTGITRNFYAYGKVTSPNVKYSSISRDATFTDNNPVAGYMIQHSLSGFGNATQQKIIETSTGRNGNFYEAANIATYVQYNYALGDTTVTPNTVGFLGDGTTYYYDVYSNKTVSGTNIYSTTARSGSITLPNDSQYYDIAISYASVSGATYKLRRKIGAGSYQYKVNAGTSITDNTVLSWGDSSTLTPTQAVGATNIVDFDSTATSQSALLIRNKQNSILGFLEFQYNTGSSYVLGAKYGVTTTGNATISAYNQGLEIGLVGTPHTKISASQGTIFNIQNQSTGSIQVKGVVNDYMAFFHPSESTVHFGTQNSNYSDPNSAVCITPKDTTDSALVLNPAIGSADSGYLLRVINSSATTWAGISNAGRGFFMTSSSGNGNLRIGAGNASYAPLQIDSSATLPNVAGGFGQMSGQWFGADNTNTMRRFVQALNTGTNTYYWRSDANGYPQADTTLYIQSGVILTAGLQISATQGLSCSSGTDLILGSSTASPGANGAMRYDSTQRAIRALATQDQRLVGCTFTQTASVTVANTITETTLTGSGIGSLTLNANYLTVGKSIRIRASGFHSAVSNPNIRIRVKFGSTTILDTTSVSSRNSTNGGWTIDAVIACRTTGVSGTVIGQGQYTETGGNVHQMVNTTTTTVNTTTSQAITVTAEWGTASASNTITCTNLEVEALN